VPTEGTGSSLYRQLGGRVGIAAVTDEFYRRVLADDALAPFFMGTDLARLYAHQAAFLAAAVGGPDPYAGRAPQEAHAGRGIAAPHFAATAGHLAAALDACGVPGAMAAVVMARVGALRDEVIDS
jgi:hemoglobin